MYGMDASARIGLKAFDILPHAVGTLFFHARGRVRIGAEREGRGGMTEVFLHGLDVIPGFQAVHRKSVAQIMKAHILHAKRPDNLFERQINRLIGEITPKLRRKDKVILVVLTVARQLRPALLPGFLLSQHIHHTVGGNDHAGLIILETAEHIRLPR